jgi:hypothetical protein
MFPSGAQERAHCGAAKEIFFRLRVEHPNTRHRSAFSRRARSIDAIVGRSVRDLRACRCGGTRSNAILGEPRRLARDQPWIVDPGYARQRWILQFVYALTLEQFDIARNDAIAVSLLIQTLQIIPTTIIGIALALSSSSRRPREKR